MRKEIKVFLLACSVCLTTVSCKPTTSKTEETEKTYREQIDSIDLEQDTLSMKLSDMVSVDATVTPESKYKNGLGIYEFELEPWGFDTKGFISRLNQYFGREEVVYEDSGEYAMQTDINAVAQTTVTCYSEPEISVASWRYDLKDSESSWSFVLNLLGDGYPVYYTESELMREEMKKLVNLFGDQFQNTEKGEFRYIIIDGEEDYKKIEEIYRKIDIELEEDETDKIFEGKLWTGGDVARERRAVYGAKFYETVGDSGLPVMSLGRRSYKNYDKKPIPDTSREGYNDEVWTNIDNNISATFDSAGNLRNIFMEKYIRIKDEPERVEQILNLRQVMDIVYEKIKDVKIPVNIYSIQLYYTGVIVEEGEGLEDYIYPVWEVQYYNSSPEGVIKIQLDAVTGREL